MSTCPEKDILSIYLDKELPQAYVAELENHVESCPKCKARLEKLKAMHQSLSDDSKSFVFDQKMLDDSYSRLQARLSYSSVTKKAVPFKTNKFKTAILSTATGVAVAAALVAIILPGYVKTGTSSKQFNDSQFQPVARTQLQPPSLAEVKVDGQINPAALSSLLASVSETESSAKTEKPAETPVRSIQQNVIPVRGATVSTNSNMIIPMTGTVPVYRMPAFEPQEKTEDKLYNNLTSYDVFNPMLNENNSESVSAGNTQGITIYFNSSLGYISFEIGSQN